MLIYLLKNTVGNASKIIAFIHLVICTVFFYHAYVCYQAPNSLGGRSGQFSLHLSHKGNRGFSLSIIIIIIIIIIKMIIIIIIKMMIIIITKMIFDIVLFPPI